MIGPEPGSRMCWKAGEGGHDFRHVSAARLPCILGQVRNLVFAHRMIQRKMKKICALAMAWLVAITASTVCSADIYKCKTPDGRTVFSDAGCLGGVEVKSTRANETHSTGARTQAVETHARRRQQLDAIEAERAAQRDLPAWVGLIGAQTPPAKTAAAADCVRDIERQGVPEREKAELVTACRTAGLSQRANGVSGEAVSDCVKRIERTGASGKDKGRQIALCHGGDARTALSRDVGRCDIGDRPNLRPGPCTW